MSIDLLNIEIRHERRMRLVFTNALAVGAFGTPGPACYSVQNLDGKTIDPVVASALIVVGNPNVVELALASDLATGAMYRVSAVGVPSTDLSVTPGGTSETFRYGAAAFKSYAEPAVRDRERLLYGVDLIWNGLDFQEQSNGDLARAEGVPNVTKALWHSIETAGLPWDPTWGVDAREYVDSPSSAAAPLAGALAAQIRKDRRVVRVSTKFVVDGAETTIFVTPILIGGDTVGPISTVVPNS